MCNNSSSWSLLCQKNKQTLFETAEKKRHTHVELTNPGRGDQGTTSVHGTAGRLAGRQEQAQDRTGSMDSVLSPPRMRRVWQLGIVKDEPWSLDLMRGVIGEFMGMTLFLYTTITTIVSQRQRFQQRADCLLCADLGEMKYTHVLITRHAKPRGMRKQPHIDGVTSAKRHQ
jgi:hypothetical protein